MLFYLPLISLLLCNISALNPIVIKGSKFFDSVTGEQFYVKGIAYQPRSGGISDPLSKPENCKRDIPYLKELGVNLIRVYEVYPKNNHDACMKLLEDAGIYLLLDLPTSKVSINREQPIYDVVLHEHIKRQIDSFHKYKNIFGFFAGNEISNDVNTTKASAHMKASLRDAKAYLKSLGSKLPVGYANNDDPKIRSQIQDYFNCGKEEERADFYGINIYSWCGNSSFKESGYEQRTSELSNYSIPSILSELGCNTVKPRPFGDLVSLYNQDMQSVLSGGIVYEYSQEDNKYGLVTISSDNKVEKLSDFNKVKERYLMAKPKGIKMSEYQFNSKPSKCPAVSEAWKSSNELPPTPSSKECQCIYSTLECHVSNMGQQPSNGAKVGEKLGYLCGQGNCDLIMNDPEHGKYGMYLTCDAKVRNSIVFSQAVKKGAKCNSFDGLTEMNKNRTNKSIKECSMKMPASKPSTVTSKKCVKKNH